MHSSIILLTLFSIILIAIMVTCFMCFIRSRRKEDEELMQRVQYNQQQQQQQQQQYQTDTRKQIPPSPSEDVLINEASTNNVNNSQTNPSILQGYETARSNPYSVAASASPYHTPATVIAPPSPRTETRSDMTQQINSAIIGSSEAEFQNDFIQVSYFKFSSICIS